MQLLSTAPTLDAIRDCVGRFYCGQSMTLIPAGEGKWSIQSTYDGVTVEGVHVVKKRNRYRFESTNS